MITPKRWQGNRAEDAALAYLKARGVTLVGRNYQCKGGEIDLIVKDQTTLVFVEVRYRKNTHRGTGAESITRSKMTKIIRAARHYLTRYPQPDQVDFRFDVIDVSTSIDWLVNAFTLDDIQSRD